MRPIDAKTHDDLDKLRRMRFKDHIRLYPHVVEIHSAHTIGHVDRKSFDRMVRWYLKEQEMAQ